MNIQSYYLYLTLLAFLLQLEEAEIIYILIIKQSMSLTECNNNKIRITK